MKFNEAVSYDPSLDWNALLQFATGERARFEPLWHSLIEKGVEEFGWLLARGYAGEVTSFEIPNGPIDQVYVWARSNHEKLFEGSEILPIEVLSVQFRYRNGQQHVKEDMRREHQGYIAIASPRELKGKDSTHIYIGVKEWSASNRLEARSDAITKACLAAIQIFTELTGIHLPGEKSS
jgi:hypothetical protein